MNEIQQMNEEIKMTNYVPASEVAKMLRQELKTLYPDTKFSIRSTHNSLRIVWTDGATIGQLTQLTNKYKGQSYDMLEDLHKYNHHVDEQGQPVHYGSDYITLERNYSVEFLNKMVAQVRAYWGGFDDKQVEVKIHSYSGDAYVISPIDDEVYRRTNEYSLDRVVNGWARRTSAIDGKKYDWMTGKEIDG